MRIPYGYRIYYECVYCHQLFLLRDKQRLRLYCSVSHRVMHHRKSKVL